MTIGKKLIKFNLHAQFSGDIIRSWFMGSSDDFKEVACYLVLLIFPFEFQYTTTTSTKNLYLHVVGTSKPRKPHHRDYKWIYPSTACLGSDNRGLDTMLLGNHQIQWSNIVMTDWIKLLWGQFVWDLHRKVANILDNGVVLNWICSTCKQRRKKIEPVLESTLLAVAKSV